MKKYLLLFVFLATFSFSEKILLSSYNIARLGESKKDYNTLSRIISKFDIIAVQEVMNTDGLDEIISRLSDYDYIISKAVGTKKYKEHYAIIYKKNKVSDIHIVGSYPDDKDDFIREPQAFYVKSNNLDMVLITAHSIFGDNERLRMYEASKYKEVYQYFYNKTKQDDIIILGDFNLPANDNSFDNLRGIGLVNILNPLDDKTTLSKKSKANAYDNIFFRIENLKAFTGRYGVYDYTVNNYEKIRKYISDHLPIFIELENNSD